MSTIDLWVPVEYVKDISKDYKDKCVKCAIPSKCPTCNFPIEIDRVGDANRCSLLAYSCAHTTFWEDIWSLRVNQPKVWLDPKIDGSKCAKCNDFVYMASANQDNNIFVCYGCRTRK